MVRVDSRALLAVVSDRTRAKGVDDFDAVKISLIVGDDDAAIGLNDGRDDCVERTLRASACFCFCHQLSPDERCLFFKREYATGKE